MLGAERLMAWGLFLSFAVGVLCALRVPILHFTIIVVLIIAGYVMANIGSGRSAAELASWSAILAVVLEAGYLFPHLLFYLVYVKLLGRDRSRLPAQTKSGLFASSPFHGLSDRSPQAEPESRKAEKAQPRIQD